MTEAAVGLWLGGAVAVGVELLPKVERGATVDVVVAAFAVVFWPVYVTGRCWVFWCADAEGGD